MKKIILASTLTLSSFAAMAQEYGSGYDYYGYTNNMVQSQPTTYYTNETSVAEQAEMNYGYMPTAQAETERAWDLKIITGARYASKYSGSKKSEFTIMALPVAQYRLDPWQKLFISLEDGAGYSYSLTRNLELGGGLGYRDGRDSKDANILTGMDDVDSSLTYMAFAKYELGNYKLGLKLEKGMDSSNDGFSTELAAAYSTMLNPQLRIGTRVSAIYGDDTFMEQNYGVSSADAIAGRAAHNASAGFSEASIKTFANYTIEGPHSVTGSVKYTKLLGDAKDSSIVEDDDDISLAVGYAYKF